MHQTAFVFTTKKSGRHGSDDRLNPTANAYLLAERIPGAELYIVEGGRHGYYAEFRKEASRVVNEFLARHPL